MERGAARGAGANARHGGGSLALRILPEASQEHFYGFPRGAVGLNKQILAITPMEKGFVYLWPEDRRAVIIQGHRDPVRALAFNPNGGVATVAAGGTVRVWSEDGKESHRLPVAGDLKPMSVAWDAKGLRLAAGGNRGLVYLWRVSKEKQDSGRPYVLSSGSSSQVTAMAFSLDGKQLLTGFMDGNARLWQLPPLEVEELQEELGRLPRPCLDEEALRQDLTEEELKQEKQECGRLP